MITGTATATVMYNLRRRHPTPTLDLPIIDYDLALLFQPVLVLGISIGVSLNVVLSDWMITILLFIVLLGNNFLSRKSSSFTSFENFLEWSWSAGVSTKSFFKGVETWKRETITKKAGFKLFFVVQVDCIFCTSNPSNTSTCFIIFRTCLMLQNSCNQMVGWPIISWWPIQTPTYTYCKSNLLLLMKMLKTNIFREAQAMAL